MSTPTFKNCRRLMVWMAIKFGERPSWRSTVETINSKVFIDIVKDVFGYKGIHRRRLDTEMLQDNALVHRSKETTASLSDCGLRNIFIPANSLDLNPIENLSALIKRNWDKARKHISMDQKLHFFNNYIDQTTIDNLVVSMPSRLTATLKAKGQSKKY
nr:unnamed protein product [Spirometra erinaceieuropaei]